MGMTTSHKVSRDQIVSSISDSIEVANNLLLGFIHVPEDNHSTISVTFKDFRYNVFDHSQLLLSGAPVVSPRLEVYIDKMYRALQPGIVKHLDMDQPMQPMGYFVGRKLVHDKHRNPPEVLFRR